MRDAGWQAGADRDGGLTTKCLLSSCQYCQLLALHKAPLQSTPVESDQAPGPGLLTGLRTDMADIAGTAGVQCGEYSQKLQARLKFFNTALVRAGPALGSMPK